MSLVAWVSPAVTSRWRLNRARTEINRVVLPVQETSTVRDVASLASSVSLLLDKGQAADPPARTYEALIATQILMGDYASARLSLGHYVAAVADTRPVLLWLARQAEDDAERGEVSAASQVRQLIAEQSAEPHYLRHIADYAIETRWLINHTGDYTRAGRYAQAEELYRLAIAVAPRLPLGYYTLGDLYLVQKRWEAAVEVYRGGLAVDMDTQARGYVGLGRAYMEQQKPDELIPVGEAALAAGAWEWGHLMLGQAAQWQGDAAGAILHYEAVVDRHSSERGVLEAVWLAHFKLAQLYEKRQQYDVAISYYRRAAALSDRNGMDARALYYAALVYYQQSLYERAETELKSVLALLKEQPTQQPLQIAAHLLLGNSYMRLQQCEQAKREYQAVLVLDPGNREASEAITLACQ